MGVKEAISQKLTEKFDPTYLEVIDESERHRGHAGWREGGETHFRVRIASGYFDPLSRVAQHRAVMDALEGEFKAGLHALQIQIVPADGPVNPSVRQPRA